MGNGAGGPCKAEASNGGPCKAETDEEVSKDESEIKVLRLSEQRKRPGVTCSSARGVIGKKGALRLDLSECVNEQNTFLSNPLSQKSSAKYFRIPNSHLMEAGDKKLLRCGGRAIAVFRLKTGWAAVDNACYHHGGPLFMGDIEEYNGQTCVTCPWHCTKISVKTGESLYECFDVKTSEHFPHQKHGGARQRAHKVIIRDEDVLIKINDAPENSYASDRYAALDIASNDETRMDPDSVDSEASSKEKMDEAIRKKRLSMKAERKQREAEKQRMKNPVRVPAGRLTPRGANSGPYRPDWVRYGNLPPPPGEEEDDDWSPAFDLAEEFRDLETEYAQRKEASDRNLASNNS